MNMLHSLAGLEQNAINSQGREVNASVLENDVWTVSNDLLVIIANE